MARDFEPGTSPAETSLPSGIAKKQQVGAGN